MKRIQTRAKTAEEFLELRVLRPETPCWNWRGHIGRQGYGLFEFQGRKGIAHRIAWEMLVGPIPEGMEVHHRCCNRGCVNPTHLELLTRDEHNSITANLQTHCKNGHIKTAENTYVSPSGHRKCRECLQGKWLKSNGYLDPQRQMASHCPKGHEYTDENTYWYERDGRRYRYCRICNREAARRGAARKAALKKKREGG